MKKIFVFLMVFLAGGGGNAANRRLTPYWDACLGANRTVYDLGSNYAQYGAVPDHTVFFEAFPYTKEICLWTGYYDWHSRKINLCPGYLETHMNQANKTNACNLSGGCWYWTCNAGHVLTPGTGQCVINLVYQMTQCTDSGKFWVDDRCVTAQERCNIMRLVWINGACQSAEQTCTNSGSVWYQNACMTQAERCRMQNKQWYNSQCMTMEQMCAAQNKVVRNSLCALPFCNGYSSFNATAHNEYGGGGTCTEYRCKTGGFTSATNHTCITNRTYNAADISTARNGYYVNNDNDAADCKRGVLCQCPATKYVSRQGAMYTCRDLAVRQAPAFNNCWQCTSKPALTACLMDGTGC